MPQTKVPDTSWSPPAAHQEFSDSEVDEAAIRAEAVRIIQGRSMQRPPSEGDDSDDDFKSIQSSPKRSPSYRRASPVRPKQPQPQQQQQPPVQPPPQQQAAQPQQPRTTSLPLPQPRPGIVTDGYVVTKAEPTPPPQQKIKQPVPRPAANPAPRAQAPRNDLKALEDGWKVKTVEKPAPKAARRPVTFNTLRQARPKSPKRSRSSPAPTVKPPPQAVQPPPQARPASRTRSTSKGNAVLKKQLLEELKSPGRLLYEKDMKEKKKAEQRVVKNVQFKKKLQHAERIMAQKWVQENSLSEIAALEDGDGQPWRPPYGGASPMPPPVSPQAPRRSASPVREVDPSFLGWGPVSASVPKKKKRSLSTPAAAAPQPETAKDPRQSDSEAYKLWLAKKEEQARLTAQKRALEQKHQEDKRYHLQAEKERLVDEALNKQRRQIERMKKFKPKTPQREQKTVPRDTAQARTPSTAATRQNTETTPPARENKWMQPPAPKPVEAYSPQELPSITEILNSPYREESIQAGQMSIFNEVPLLNANYSDDFLKASASPQYPERGLFDSADDTTQSQLQILQQQQVAHELQLQKEALEKELTHQRDAMQQMKSHQQQVAEQMQRQQQEMQDQMQRQHEEHLKALEKKELAAKLAEEEEVLWRTLPQDKVDEHARPQEHFVEQLVPENMHREQAHHALPHMPLQMQQVQHMPQAQHVHVEPVVPDYMVQVQHRLPSPERPRSLQDVSLAFGEMPSAPQAAVPIEYNSYHSFQSLPQSQSTSTRYQPIKSSIGPDLLEALRGRKKAAKKSPGFKLRLLFMNADQNGDGYVSPEEAFIALAEAGYPEPGDDTANDALSAVDPQQRGFLTFYQFQRLVALMYGDSSSRQVSPRRAADIDVY